LGSKTVYRNRQSSDSGNQTQARHLLVGCFICMWASFGIDALPIEPGVILIGEDGDDPDAGATRPTWAKDSSFLVFRKLRQFVPEFNQFLANNPIRDKGLTPAQGSELLGAYG